MINTTSKKLETLEESRLVIEELSNKILKLESQLAWFNKHVFGRRSEKTHFDTTAETLDLFGASASEQEVSVIEKSHTIASHTRKKRRTMAEALPAGLPREKELLDLSEDEKKCPCCSIPMKMIGTDITEELEKTPGSLWVRQIIRPKYACPSHPEEGVAQIKAPQRLIRGGIGGAGVVAEVIADKYVRHLPLERQVDDFMRMGVSISKATLCGWIAATDILWDDLFEHFKSQIIAGDIAYSDDTTLPVQDKGLKNKVHRGYLWLYSNGTDSVCFEYCPGRSREGPRNFLSEFSGFLHCDGYQVYQNIKDITPVICWAHARRKYIEAVDAKFVDAGKFIRIINRLFKIERLLKRINPEISVQRVKQARERLSTKVLCSFWGEIKQETIKALPAGKLGEAMAYSLKYKNGLEQFLRDGRLKLDNNLSERQIRHTVIGRKNWLFAGSHEAAARMGKIFSAVASCKLIGVDPVFYLRWVLHTWAQNKETPIHELTPMYFKNILTEMTALA